MTPLTRSTISSHPLTHQEFPIEDQVTISSDGSETPSFLSSVESVDSVEVLAPHDVEELKKRYTDYLTALQHDAQEPVSWSSFLFGRPSKKEVQRSLQALSEYYNETQVTNAAVEDTIAEFNATVVGQGGDPQVAHETLNATLGIADLDAKKSNQQKEIRSLANLSEKEIHSFIKNIKDDELHHFAHALFPGEAYIQDLQISELRALLVQTCCELSHRAQRNILLGEPEVIPIVHSAFLMPPHSIEEQGLGNGGVDCYLSSALQCLRDRFSMLPPQQQREIIHSLEKKYVASSTAHKTELSLLQQGSPLAAFLEYKFDGRNVTAAAFLRREIKGLLADVDNGDAREVANIIHSETGNSLNQYDATQAMNGLIEALEIPQYRLKQMIIEDIPNYGPISSEGPDENVSLWVFSGISQDTTTLQNIIAGEVQSQRNDGAVIHKYLSDPPPESLTISLSRFAFHTDRGSIKLTTPLLETMEPVTFRYYQEAASESHEAFYTPSSIICHYGEGSANSGHYVTYRKQNDQWYLLNDSTTTPVDLDETPDPTFGTLVLEDQTRRDMTHREFLERNAYVINYQRAS
jgi:hypothetical protein